MGSGQADQHNQLGQFDSVDRQLLKQINHFVRAHAFITHSLNGHTTTQRRTFERDIYDYARNIGLLKEQARLEVRKARAFCGELDYDSDGSRLGDEIDDSRTILKAATLETASATKSMLAEGLPIEYVSIKVSEPRTGMIIGRKGRTIDKNRRISGSAIGIQYPEDDSNERHVHITGTHEHNRIALDMIAATTPDETRNRLGDSHSITTPAEDSEALGDQNPAAEARNMIPATSKTPQIVNGFMEHKAENTEPAPSFSTLAALRGDTHPKSAKKSSTKALALDSVFDNVPKSREEMPSIAKESQLNVSRRKKAHQIEQDCTKGDLNESSANDNATAAQKTRAKKQGKKQQKAQKAKAQTLDKIPQVKRLTNNGISDTVCAIAAMSSTMNHGDEAVNDPAIANSAKADSTTITSDGKSTKKRKKGRKTKTACSNEQSQTKDTATDKVSGVELPQTPVEASCTTKKKRKARLPKETDPPTKKPAKVLRENVTKSQKSKGSPLAHKEQHEVYGETKVETKITSKSAGKSRKNGLAELAPVMVNNEGQEVEEEVRSEYFTPRKSKSKGLLFDSRGDSEVETQDTSPSKGNLSVRMRMEDKRREFYAELRRRSSLGHTVSASLEGKEDTTVPKTELHASAHKDQVEDENRSKGESVETRNDKQVAKAKRRNLKKHHPTAVEESISVIDNGSSNNPASSQSAWAVRQDQQISVVDPITKPIITVSKKKNKREQWEDSAAAYTAGMALGSESNDIRSSADRMSITATTIVSDLNKPIVSLHHSGWNPVNQAIVEANKLAESFGSQPPYAGVGSNIRGVNRYIDDPMEVDQENWAVSSDHQADPHFGQENASRKRKKTADVEELRSGIMTRSKKPWLLKEEAGTTVDFSTPMIR